MRRALPFAAAAVGIAAAASLAVGAAGQADVRPEPPPAFTKVCVRCHASDKVVEGRRYPAQWDQVIEQMVARGATGTEEEFDAVYDYLVAEFGRVEINKAPAGEIAQVLHLEPEVAAAIVRQRPLADFDALKAVPGVPAGALDKRRDAIVF